jgi:catechol 2,3-dioxygenase-like lactoylglutathione lyase family enzyme
MQQSKPNDRRADCLGVHSLDSFCLEVPDLAVAQAFYREFGLDVESTGTQLFLRTKGQSQVWGRIVKGDRKRLHHLSFGAYADDLPRFRQRLEQRDIALLPPPSGFDAGGIWFRGTDGVLLEIHAAEKSSPAEKSLFVLDPPVSEWRGTVSRSAAPRVFPRRLAHVALFSADVGAAITFYSDVLGLRLSDRSADIVAFLHGPHGSEHHMIAFVKSGGPGFHHCSWDVGSVQEVGLGASHMEALGYDRGWGLGRHVLGSNYFFYVRDPWGSYCEYSAGMDFIPAQMEWQASDQPVEDSMFLWGPNPSGEFIQNHELNESNSETAAETAEHLLMAP